MEDNIIPLAFVTAFVLMIVLVVGSIAFNNYLYVKGNYCQGVATGEVGIPGRHLEWTKCN